MSAYFPSLPAWRLDLPSDPLVPLLSVLNRPYQVDQFPPTRVSLRRLLLGPGPMPIWAVIGQRDCSRGLCGEGRLVCHESTIIVWCAFAAAPMRVLTLSAPLPFLVATL
jgi:hypothetical protein